MPVTRSQVGSTKKSETVATTESSRTATTSGSGATGTSGTTGTLGATVAHEKTSASGATGTPGTSGTSGATGNTGATGATDATATTSRTRQRMEEPATEVERDSREKIQGRQQSIASSGRMRKRRELEAKAELMRLDLLKVQAETALARVRLELIQLEDNDSDVEPEPADREEEVQKWVEKTVERMSGERRPSEAEAISTVKPEEQQQVPATQSSSDGAKDLAEAIIKAISAAPKTGHTSQPSYLHELPAFDGSCSEWLAFKTVYEDTASLFTSVQNMARLRRAIKGAAREAVKSLLYSDCTPEEVLEALQRRFGRPDALVLLELEKMRSLPKITDNARDVCVFASQVNNTVASIRGLKRPQYLHSPELMKTIIEKMPAVLRYRWFDFSAEREEDDPDMIVIAKFLNREAERCGPFAAQEITAPRRTLPQRQTTHAAMEAAPGSSCPNCEEDHRLPECRKFLNAGKKERWEMAMKARVCFKCLQARHRKENCKKPACKTCNRWHHHLLHSEKKEEKMEEEKHIANNVRLPVNAARAARAYLKMVPVEIFGPRGSARVLALLDEGSTVTLLDSSVAQGIGLRGPIESLSIETVGGKTIVKRDSMCIDASIKGVYQPGKKRISGVRTIDDICLTPQRIERSRIEDCAHLRPLARQLHYEEEPPKLLIGQDNWELIVTRSMRRGKRNQPVASLTHLGWVLHGSDEGHATRRINFVTCAHVSTREDELDLLIKEHFAVESLGVQPRRPSTDAEGRALAILEKTSRRLENGRFEVGLLWKSEEEQMPDNFKAAENRLRNIERKLDKDPELKMEYGKQVQNLLDSGYAEVANHESASKRKWYLPHFAVTHPTKKKKRLVFDAAAKCGGKSLNDALLPGPDLLQSLFGVLLRFRQWPIAVVADIKEMFLQVKIKEEDRDSLRFLWRGERRTGQPTEYRMTSVIFGAACSPSAAIFIKNKNAAEFENVFPEAARAVERNHYMDDYLHCFKTEDDAVRVAGQVDAIHQNAGFVLRGWASNNASVLRRLAKEEDASREVELGSKEEKTLGLRWFTQEDRMGFRVYLRDGADVVNEKKTPTKREVTSAVMSTFDPMGLASPVLIQGKKLLQDIWRNGIGWDEDIKTEDEASWQQYLSDLQLLKDLRVPRCIAHFCTEGELHVFTDASETTYACAVYWRQEDSDGPATVTLLAGKARVTPLKPVSIPRLELQAALLGARMAHSIGEELDLQVKRKTYWTDSSTVLSWIKADPRTFKPFVAHRLAEIEDTSRPHEWRWVPTAQNPADDATRGIPEGFDENHRWFTGPEFLRKKEDAWPQPRTFKAESTGEEKTSGITAAAREVSRPATPDPARFSSWNRLLRATARVLQFIELCKMRRHRVNITRREKDPAWRKHAKKRKQTRLSLIPKEDRRFLPLDSAHLQRAEWFLLKRSQEDSFPGEMKAAAHRLPPHRASRLRRLDVVEEDGLLRLKGRIDAAADLDDSYRRPVVLDSKHHITRLIVSEFHSKFNHGNHATVMNELRQRYWILGLRAAVRATAHQCQWCKVHRSAPTQPPPGDLPRERLRRGEPPFTCLGVDLFGPMTVTVGRRHEKRWGVLFTCLVSRAVHIELAPSLSTDSMVLALRRMAARRGYPKIVFSDNGTNLVGASRELMEATEELKKEDLVTEAEKIGVRWKFIPPGAPNMGGAWERLVGSIKRALSTTLKERQPREEVLHTLLLEAEHIVNSRPLVDIEENLEEEALTPNHFLIGRSCGLPRLGAVTDGDLSGKRTWRMAQRLADHFWSRWVREYLPTLLPRKIDGKTTRRDVHRGDVVLLVDPSLPRGIWPRGEVIRTLPGPDGRTRVLEVRTSGGILRRPCTKVVVLVPVQTEPGDGVQDVTEPEDGAAHKGEDVGDECI